MLITEETLYSVADDFYVRNKDSELHKDRDVLVMYGYSTVDIYSTIICFAYWVGDINTENDIKKKYSNIVKKWNYAYFDCHITNMPLLVNNGKKKNIRR